MSLTNTSILPYIFYYTFYIVYPNSMSISHRTAHESLQHFINLYFQLWQRSENPPTQDAMLQLVPDTIHCVPQISFGLPPQQQETQSSNGL